MEHGFLKVAAVTPEIKVADPKYNTQILIEKAEEACKAGAKVVVFPELCLSSYTCNDLFLQRTLLEECEEGLLKFAEATDLWDTLFFVGLPFCYLGKLYNVAAVVYGGEILALIPKRFLPNYAEFYEARHFTPGPKKPVMIEFHGNQVPFGTNILLQNKMMPEMVVGCEICEDIWVPDSPSIAHAMAGATLLVNLSASDETVGKDSFRRMLVQCTSAKLLAGYIYASAGAGESSQDLVFGGHDLIAENGTLLAESKRFETGILYAELDLFRMVHERRRMTTYLTASSEDYLYIPFEMEKEMVSLTRFYSQTPFVPAGRDAWEKRCDEILSIQSMGLRKRYEHTGCKYAVVGISGGLDSTLALLVTVRAFDMLGIPRDQIYTITMPCFGTTDRTYSNSIKLMETLGTHVMEVDIKEAVTIHFRDIGQDIDKHDVTYENGQARERTQILMDVANRIGGMVIGTGDMSELALGWATYNGDHMSMYGVNVGVPKTLVRHLVQYYADTCEETVLRDVLLDVLDTPVSPELLPPVDGKISQKTEDLVGPYELHDFFLYYMLRCGFEPAKIYRLARHAFQEAYSSEVILKWLKTFYRRYYQQQFKRSCLPDGPKVGSVAVSPRGDLRMPSDACVRIWMDQIETLC